MTAGQLAAAGMVLAIGAPLLLAGALPVRQLRPVLVTCAPFAALPAVLLGAAFQQLEPVEWSRGLLGLRLGSTGAVTRSFLLLTSCVWLASGLFGRAYLASDPNRARFWSLFLLTYAGNLGLVLARDVASFYGFYALMTFAAYGLVVHEQTVAARRAGGVYVIMALAGELLLLAGLFLVVGARVNLGLEEVPELVAASPLRGPVVGLLLVGFGVKAGAIGLHVWLPLAHPVAPTPASAALSGAMIKAGLLGWLQFLPLGHAALSGPGLACVAAGLAAAFYGVAVGVTQPAPKTILAYSSISQLGLITTALGVGLASPAAAPAAVAAILLYALHHAFAKGALFLGTGVANETGAGWPGRLVALGLLWPALDLAGAPGSGGALAKLSLKGVVALSPWAPALLEKLLSLAAAGTTLLMAHFLVRSAPRSAGKRHTPRPGLWMPWASLLLLELGLVVATPGAEVLLGPGKLLGAAWPLLAGVAAFAALSSLRRRRGSLLPGIPPGDLLVLFSRGWRTVRAQLPALRASVAAFRVRPGLARSARVTRIPELVLRAVERTEESLAAFELVGALFLALLGLTLAAVLALAS